MHGAFSFRRGYKFILSVQNVSKLQNGVNQEQRCVSEWLQLNKLCLNGDEYGAHNEYLQNFVIYFT